MNTVEKGLSILRKAESALREAASEAAAAGDYAATMRLAGWGEQLCRLSASAGPGRSDKGAVASSFTAPVASPITAPRGRGEERSKPGRRDDTYPRFCRKGDLLVKVGWSKREKSEYRHKAPRPVLDAVVEALGAAASDQTPIAIRELLPLKASSGEELPPYQVYVCLAWLRKIGLIEQHGREGYSIPRSAALVVDVSAAWDGLDRRRAS